MLETEVPTRADIFNQLNKVKAKKGLAKDKAGRNAQRKATVKAALPVEVFNHIESDLPSYTAWEKEVDDDET